MVVEAEAKVRVIQGSWYKKKEDLDVLNPVDSSHRRSNMED